MKSMGSVIKGNQANPGESAAKALRQELLQRFAGNPTPVYPTSPSLPPHVLQEIQRASEKGSSRGTKAGDDARKIVKFFGSGESSESSLANILLAQRSLPNSQCTAASASSLGVARTLSGPGAVGGVKKRRTRPSKKPPTRIVESDPTKFRDLVQTLTGGTFCSQTSIAASPIISTPSVIRKSVVEISDSAGEPYVVRSQPSRLSAEGTEGEYEEVSNVQPLAKASPVSQELPELPAFVFQGSEDAGGLDEMMGYTNQNSWIAMYNAMTTKSPGVSSSSQLRAAGLFWL